MCLNCKPIRWTIADYEYAIKIELENIKPGDVVDGQMQIQAYQKIIDEKKGKRKTLRQLRETFIKLQQIKRKHLN